MDIKMALIMDYVAQSGMPILRERCPKCDFPLIKDVIVHCANCTTKREQAQKDKTLWTLVNLASRGIFVGPRPAIPQNPYKPFPVKEKEDPEEKHWSPFSHGMPI